MTEPTCDLVDRTELRRWMDDRTCDAFSDGWRAAARAAIAFLDAMPSVECPRGWTRDEVLHELDTHPGAVCEVLSPFSGQYERYFPGGLIKRWHPEVRRYDVRVVLPPVTVWVPLTKLVGRTLKGEAEAVAGEPFYISGKGWHYQDADRWAHGIPVDLESGRVEVLAEGDA